jgi:helicase
MRIASLETYKISPDILAVWERSLGAELLPVQERAVQEYGLFDRGNLLVFAPTSSGKTFIGEMAAVKAAREHTKVFYLVPQKALAEEKYQEFTKRYEGTEIKVVVSSHDRREFDEDIGRGTFNLAIVVFEKLQSLLVSVPQLMDVIGLVVVDEMQVLTDATRGPTLELLLTKLRIAKSHPRIVGLSAVLGQAERLAAWLDARMLVDARRPIELRKGILCHGTFTYREHNTGQLASEAFPDNPSKDDRELLLGAAADLVGRGEQVLIFVPDRASTIQFARRLSARVGTAPLASALDELRDHEPTHARDQLLDVLGRAIGFHNADMSPEERELVERHFRSGGIRALFSTSTLAVGMNLPAKNVILDHQRWQYLRTYNRWGLVDITKSEYEQMSGRAGRLGLTDGFGRSILVSYSRFDADAWMRKWVEADFESIEPTLANSPLADHVVNLLASGLAESRDGLRALLLGSFTGHVRWQKAAGDEFTQSLDAAVQKCVDAGMAKKLPSNRLAATPLGRVCAMRGLDVDSGIELAKWVQEGRTAAISPLEVLTVLGLTRAGQGVHVTLRRDEPQTEYLADLLRRARDLGAGDRPIFAHFDALTMMPDYDILKGIKKALFLAEWIAEKPIAGIERTYRIGAGTVRRTGEDYGWLVEALAGIAVIVKWHPTRVEKLRQLADRLSHGVRGSALPLARLRVRGLGPALMRRLVNAGLADEAALLRAGEEAVRTALNNKRAFAALWARLLQEQERRQQEAEQTRTTGAEREGDVIDLVEDSLSVGVPSCDSTATPCLGLVAAAPASVVAGPAGDQPAGGAVTGSGPGSKHEVRFISEKKVEIDGIEVVGEIVPVLRELRNRFLEDQREGHGQEEYERLKGLALAAALGLEDDSALRRRVLTFRKRLAVDYRARYGRDIHAQAIIENASRTGYRLNPRSVALVA